ncbi:unnamed protein product [Mycena citricolor]|uniref:Uncharacterized protein n=1 Tax=Mycena citricolor TaxID=2018698 RepID=A0AAD2H4N0_9AGAR|nr:unnamed protein product [Mycena citricolor]
MRCGSRVPISKLRSDIITDNLTIGAGLHLILTPASNSPALCNMSSPPGMLFFAMEADPEVTEERLNDWYDNEHIPLRLKVSGLNTVTRYKATDGQVPTWLAMYNCDTPAVVQSEGYTSLAALGSENEKDILSRFTSVSRRIYEHVSTTTAPGVSDEELPAKFIYVAGLEVPGGAEDDLNRWCVPLGMRRYVLIRRSVRHVIERDQEHIDMFSKIPGWKQTRRYQIIEHKQFGAAVEGRPVCKFLAVHEFDNGDFVQTPEMRDAVSSEWAKRVLSTVVQKERRVFGLHKGFRA